MSNACVPVEEWIAPRHHVDCLSCAADRRYQPRDRPAGGGSGLEASYPGTQGSAEQTRSTSPLRPALDEPARTKLRKRISVIKRDLYHLLGNARAP
jgi:hypothetical protein